MLSSVSDQRENTVDYATEQGCPLCSGCDLEIFMNSKDGVLNADTLGSSRTEVTPGKILRCRTCGFVFSAFRPTDEELHTLYREMDPTVYERETPGRQRTAERHLKMVQQYLTSGRLVDVGCASGSFLSVAADAGWMVTGVEPSEILANRAIKALTGRGEIYCSTLQRANLSSSSFDALTLWDVLEHVTHPVSFLTDCVRLLKPGGYLFLNLPDISSIQARFLRERWPLFLPEHLNYFDRNTLKFCAEKTGLEWVGFDRRPASFTLRYVLYRLAQHKIPTTTLGYKILQNNALGNLTVPVYLGETFGVWRRSP
jgi:SAM-dependent methyltransferase